MKESQIIDSVSIDCVVMGFEQSTLKVLLIKRKSDPKKGMWALPGGFVQEDEDLNDAAQRILTELTGLNKVFMQQVQAFGDVSRFPVRRVVTIAYFAFVKPEIYTITPGLLTEEAAWVNVDAVPDLVFDHNHILESTIQTVRRKIRNEPIGFEMLPDRFTLPEFQKLYEAVLDRKMDKRNFRKKILKMSLLVPSGETQKGVKHRAARLYRFDELVYNDLKEKGFCFEL
jgi:8-oxo-dGTP diphosphatase